MKTKLLLLLAMSIGLVSSAWAEDVEISNADELAAFAERVNGGEFDLNAVLTDDIDMSELDGWTAIGDWGGVSGTFEARYTGHFDGQGHSITGFKFTSTHNYYGIFGVVAAGGIVENFTVSGKMTLDYKTGGVVGYTKETTATVRNIHSDMEIVCTGVTSAQRPGGIVGSAVNGTTVVENCTFSGIINVGGRTGNIGGIVGYVNNNAAAIVNITNCLFYGEIKNGNANGQCGGIIGYNNGGTVTVKNCLSIGTITTGSGNDGMFIGQLNGSNTTFTNNYYVGDNVNGTGSGKSAKGSAPVKVTETQLASGEVCFLLNESVNGGTNWFQSLIDDEYPTPYGSDKVYANGSFNCDMTPKEGVPVTYGNTDEANIDPHNFSDGFCTVCGAFNESWLTANGEGYYEIGTPAQLKWFAVYANTIDHAANAILVDDITFTEAWTTPIGGGSGSAGGATAYTGTFDGQGYSITGFNVENNTRPALFGDVTGATIKNFSISGTITATGGYGGGVVGWPTNSTIENVYSALVIDVPNTGTHHVGGVVGSARGGNTISSCSFSGSLTVASSTDNFAGIAGYITNGDKVINCANYADVTFSAAGCAAGGIVGYVNSQSAYVQNSLTTGKILLDGDGSPNYGAAILGRTKGYAAEKVTNNYWLEGSAYAASKKDDGSDPLATGSVTVEQLSSGEVAYKLGEDWGQLLDADSYPTPSYDVKVNYVGEAGYATMYDETSGYEFNGDVEAYVAVPNKNYPNLILTKIDNVPASTPVILKGTYYNKVEADLKSIDIDNVLKGAATDVEAEGKYILAKPAEKEVGFYLAETGTIKAGKAYIELDGNASVKALFFAEEDGETAINNVNVNDNVNNAAIYNIAGQRISKLQKGINIINGRKVLY